MDESIKQIFMTFDNLEVDKCKKIEKPYSNKIISIDYIAYSLTTFLKENTKIRTIDAFPDKNNDLSEPSDMGYIRKWGVIKFKEESIGYVDEAIISNAYPTIFNDTEAFLNNTIEVYKKGIELLSTYSEEERKQLRKFDMKTEARTFIYLSPKYFSMVKQND